MTKNKLQLQILDAEGNVKVTHHFFFDVNDDSSLRLTITDNVYVLDKDGKQLITEQHGTSSQIAKSIY